MPGYFNDGTINIELGEHVFATPALGRSQHVIAPHSAPARVHDAGGGAFGLTVTGQRLRANLGDAEAWAYNILLALATSAPGELGIEDERGNPCAFGNAVCVGGAAEVQAFRFVTLSLDFETPEKSSEPAYGVAPVTPGVYGGTATLQDYAAGGVPLGDHPVSLRIEMSRTYPLREVARARGSRARGPASGAVMRLAVTGHEVERASSLAARLEALASSIGPAAVDLTGNGNTFEDVLLASLAPEHNDRHAAAFAATFVQEI